MTMTQAKPTPAQIDAIGGVRCHGCGEPMMKIVSKDGEPINVRAVLFVKHKPCGHYNVIDLEA